MLDKLRIFTALHLAYEHDIDLFDTSPEGGLNTALSNTEKSLNIVYHLLSDNTYSSFEEFLDTVQNLDTLQKLVLAMYKEIENFYPPQKEVQRKNQDPDFDIFDKANEVYFSIKSLYFSIGRASLSLHEAGNLSLRELLWIVEGRDRQLWDVFAPLITTVINCHSQEKTTVEEVNPFLRSREIPIEEARKLFSKE